jgi:peroxiredoxin
MRQLREFAQHKPDFDQLNTRVVGISVDSQEDANKVWDKMTNKQFTILSDPGAVVIKQYGLLHVGGKGDEDIAIRTTLLIDEQGRERWRRVSGTVTDIPTSAEALQHIRETK